MKLLICLFIVFIYCVYLLCNLLLIYCIYLALSPCSSKGNNCSHLCFTLSPTQFSCGCPTGMMLSEDNFTCTNALKHFEIYFTDSGMKSIYYLVKYINQDGFTIKPLAVPVAEGLLGYPVAIDYDTTTGNLYWTDIESQKVCIV